MNEIRRPPIEQDSPLPDEERLDGRLTEPDLRRQVATNQVRSAAQWNDTSNDMIRNSLIRACDEAQQSRREIFALIALAFVVLILGLLWSFNNYRHEHLVASERAAAQLNPYIPETIH